MLKYLKDTYLVLKRAVNQYWAFNTCQKDIGLLYLLFGFISGIMGTPLLKRFRLIFVKFRNIIYQLLINSQVLTGLIYITIFLKSVVVLFWCYLVFTSFEPVLAYDSSPFYTFVVEMREKLFWETVNHYKDEDLKLRLHDTFKSSDKYLIYCYICVMTGYCAGLPLELAEQIAHAVAMTLDPAVLLQIVDTGREYFIYPPYHYLSQKDLCHCRLWMFESNFRELHPPWFPPGYQHQARLLVARMLIELYCNGLIDMDTIHLYEQNLERGGVMPVLKTFVP